jgi:DNA polymerase-4
MPALCRDCLTTFETGTRCPACRSPRVTAHPELFDLTIAHMDCDAFFASVEKRDNPDLRDKPVIVGGGRRGVVSTACYLARIKGVRSAMPMFQALKLCPEAVVLRPRFEAYVEASRAIRAMMDELTPAIQPLSLDEAFMDLSGTIRLHGHPPAVMLARLVKRMQDDLGLTGSIGLSHNKFLAKIASDLDKPRGFSIIGRAEAMARLTPLPVRKIWGVGPALEAALEKDGIRTIGQLQTMDLADLMRRHGSMGQRLYHLSRGQDDRPVTPGHDTKSVSAETTFNTDMGARDDLVPPLRALSEEVSQRLKKQALSGRTITLKLKTRDFKSRTRALSLPDPTQLADRIFRAGVALLEREIDGTLFRLIGIGVSDLDTPARADPADLVDEGAGKRAKAELAVDALREKFGGKAVETGWTFGRGKRGR